MAGKKGKSGRRKQPAAVLKLRGTFRDDRHRDDVVAPDGAPMCPQWLGSVARKHWRVLIRELKLTPGMLTKLDRDSLAAYCDAWEEYQLARQLVMDEGLTVIRGDKRVAHPAIAIRNEAWRRMRAGMAQFGLSPSDRAGIRIEPTKQVSKWDAYRSQIQKGA